MDNKLISDIGLSFVFDKLDIKTPYGKEQLGKLRPFTQSDNAILNGELDNIGILIDNHNGVLFAKIAQILPQFKEIRPIIERCSGTDHVPDEVELFELKNFLISLEELAKTISPMDCLSRLSRQMPGAMTGALDLLDSTGSRLRSFFIPDSQTQKLKSIREVKRRLEAAIISEEREEEKKLLRDKRLLIVCEEEDEELLIRREFKKGINIYRDDFLANASAIGYLDLLLQKVTLAKEYSCTRPIIINNEENCEVIFNEVYNPFIADILKKRKKVFTPVSIKLRKGTCVLTGANMGGKSVALKTFTLNIILFQMGFYVFADEARLPIFDFIHLVYDDPESIDKGLSTFAGEIVKLKEIINDLENGFGFIALDEFARGTNPTEGASLVLAIARFLNEQNSISILSTHYDKISSEEFNNYQVIGLKNLDHEGLKDKILAAAENPVSLISEYMDYRLQKPDPDTSEDAPKDAINICKLLNLSGKILNLL
ncbi:MAG: hypothetical protein FWG77_11410 [Treponema sp.]|nr:hypothetical protein [Treponema sp.]